MKVLKQSTIIQLYALKKKIKKITDFYHVRLTLREYIAEGNDEYDKIIGECGGGKAAVLMSIEEYNSIKGGSDNINSQKEIKPVASKKRCR